MKLVEIRPEVKENPCGYSSRRSSNPTGKMSAMDIDEAIKTSEYRAVNLEDFKFSIQISPEEWEYISKYAQRENLSMEIAVQWFWTVGFRVMRNIHRMKASHPSL